MFRVFLIGLLAGALGFAAEPPCPKPPTEPAWLQDFTPLQKKTLEVAWAPIKESPNGQFTIEGSYLESESDPHQSFEEYEHESEIDAREVWSCKGPEAEFVGIAGKVKTRLEWEKKAPIGEEEFESEDNFEIHGISDYRHVSHQSEHSLEIESPGRKQEVEETKEWKQTWDQSGKPLAQGEWIYEETSDTRAGARGIASVEIPGFEPRPLPHGRRLVLKTKKFGRYNGPLEPLVLNLSQEVEHYAGDKLAERKSITGKQKAFYPYNVKKKAYEFERMDFWHEETSQNLENKVAFQLHRWESWLTPDSPRPTYTSYWKYTKKQTKFGASTEFIVKSDGHGILPRLFHIRAKNGTLTRTSDYSSGGRLKRFMVIYYPPKGRNLPLIDLQFSEFGKLESAYLDDGTNRFQKFENPLANPNALQLLQQRIAVVKKLESMHSVRYFPVRKTRAGDFPQVSP